MYFILSTSSKRKYEPFAIAYGYVMKQKDMCCVPYYREL